jgi:choline dehydrogenase-like flavoprotein
MTRWLVVGGGTAGCVVAANLATGRPADEVVLVEAGPAHAPSTPADGDVGPFVTDRDRLASVAVAAPGDPAATTPARSYLHGFGLGGGSLVNAGVVVGDPGHYRHRLPLEPAEPIGALGRALLTADPAAAPVLLARRGGRRVTVAEAYLAEPPSNLTMVTGTSVVRLAFDGRRVIGAVTAWGEDVPADHVAVCAGAIGTPALLLGSGVDTPGVGVGLQDHLGVSLAVQALAGGADPTAPAIAVTAEHGDRQLLAIEPSVAGDGYGALVSGWLAVVGGGAVTLPEPDGPPRVAFAGVSDPVDERGLMTAVAALLRLATHPSVRGAVGGVYVDEHGTTLDQLLAEGDEAVRRWAATAPSPYHHAAGSCRRGVVTDDDGWVRGYTGLAVCDASALPGVPRQNVFLSVVDLAERLSSTWVTNGVRHRL